MIPEHRTHLDARTPDDVASDGPRLMEPPAAASQYEGHAHHGENAFKRLFWVSLVLAIPAVIYAQPIQMLLVHWIEMRAVGSAQSALGDLAKLLLDTAQRIVEGRG